MASKLTVENLFDTAMDATAKGLQATGFSKGEPWEKLIPRLQKVVGKTFEPSEYAALDDLRKAVWQAQKKGTNEGAFLAAGGGIAKGAGGSTLADREKVLRCAALKTLRHTHYHARRGNHKMGIVSLPDSYSEWPDRYLAGTTEQLIVKLGDAKEHFSAEQRKHMSDATQRSLKWVHKAEIVLDDLRDI